MTVDGQDRRFGRAWLGLCLALGVHVLDEATTGFLAVYNPAVEAIRSRAHWLPLPTFSFRVWLGLLILAVACLVGLSVFAFRGARWLRPLAYAFATLMLFNAAGHAAGTIYLRRPMPGVYSSPLLLAGAIWLLLATRRGHEARAG